MRLINCRTLELESDAQWPNRETPPYAILSHTWAQTGAPEVTYQDYLNRGTSNRHLNWSKIDKAVKLATAHGKSYIWIDNCCIDKASSSELGEAINSMFKWYAAATLCFVQIEDFDSAAEDAASPSSGQPLDECRWFFRGWTLQELIAPLKVEFYDMHWRFFGTRSDLSARLASITNIDTTILHSDAKTNSDRNLEGQLGLIPIARRMSWARYRQTSRVEDEAYSLLGIFDVNMPMLYGEGDKAFQRLQEEIMKVTNDLSLFAWRSEGQEQVRGILAHSPREFADMGSASYIHEPSINPEFAMTNKGLRITTPFYTTIPQTRTRPNGNAHGELLVPLNIYTERSGKWREELSIRVSDLQSGCFVRKDAHELPPISVDPVSGSRNSARTIYIMRDVKSTMTYMATHEHLGSGRLALSYSGGFAENHPFELRLKRVWPVDSWQPQQPKHFVTQGQKFDGYLEIELIKVSLKGYTHSVTRTESLRAFVLGMRTRDFRPHIWLSDDPKALSALAGQDITFLDTVAEQDHAHLPSVWPCPCLSLPHRLMLEVCPPSGKEKPIRIGISTTWKKIGPDSSHDYEISVTPQLMTRGSKSDCAVQ